MDNLEKYRTPDLQFWDKGFMDWSWQVDWVSSCNQSYWVWGDNILSILKSYFQMKSGDIKNSFQSIRINGNKIKEFNDLLIPITIENDGLTITAGGKYLAIRSEESINY